MKNIKFSVLITLLICIIPTINAQGTNPLKRNLAIGFSASPNFVFTGGFYKSSKNGSFRIEQGFSFDANVDIQIPIKNKLTLVTGLGYSKYNAKGGYYCESCDFFLPEPTFKLDNSAIQIPLILRYQLSQGEFNFYAGTGLIYQGMIEKECEGFCPEVYQPQPKNLFVRTEIGFLSQFDERFGFLFNVHFDASVINREIMGFNKLGATAGININLGK